MNHKRWLWLAALTLILPAGNRYRAQPPPATGPLNSNLYAGLRWRMIGPFRGGRTRAATGVPSQPNVYYAGQVNGGVWKSDDYGRTWNPVFDDQPTQSIGAIAVAPSDPNVVYVASGEGLQRPDLSVGDGIYRSADAGKTWTHLGLRDGQQIPTLAIDPQDPNRVFAAVLGHPYGPNEERGIFRSTDGGQSWQKMLYKDENTGGCDVEIDSSSPNVVYATLWRARQGPWEDDNEYGGAGGGIFKSTDGGNTWRKLAGGLPENLVQAYVAIAPSDARRLYATVAWQQTGADLSGKRLGIYRSDDAGETWYQVTTDRRPAERIGGGDLPVPKVDPKNPDVLYSTSIVAWRSADGGKTWTGFRGAPGGDDYQNIWINPNDPRIILLVSDQGAIVTVNGGNTWSSWYNQPTAQLYHVITDDGFPYRVYGGQQESGSVGIVSRGNDGEITFRDWHPVGAIEYGYVAPDPLHPQIVYGAGRNEVSKFDWTTGQVQNITPIPIRDAKYRTERTEPIMFSPVDPHILYYAASVLFETTDGGHSWQAISPDLARPHPGIPSSLGGLAAKDPKADKQRGAIYALGPSFKDVSTLWAGTDDGFVWVTHDGGKSWKNVTPPPLTPWSKVTQISASHFDEQSAYASVSRFRIDDLRPYIYRTHDGGQTWQLIVNGLRDDSPVDTVREDPVRKGLLFASTEKAVWVSFDDGDHWQSLQLNLPHTAMRDLWIHDSDLIVATHGRSFWILDDITPLREITDSVSRSTAYLFKPRTAYRIRRDTYTDTPLPPDEPAGENPPDGAIVYYFLGAPVSGPATLEILDAQGKLVRRYASTDQPPVTEADLAKTADIPLYWLRKPETLSADIGMHRWVWDLRYPPPETNRHEYPISAIPHDTPRLPLGPSVVPGEFTVRLSVNGRSFTEPLTVKLDPRVMTSLAGLEQQFQLETRLASLMNGCYEAVGEARSLIDQLVKTSKPASAESRTPAARTLGSIAALVKKVRTLVESEAQPSSATPEATLTRVNREAGSLYGEVDRADAAPTVSQMAAAADIERESAEVLSRWNSIKTSDLPALNQQLSGGGLPQIRIQPQPQPEDESEDLE